MKEEELLNFIEKINTEKCVVILGPHLPTEDNSSILTKLNISLDEQLEKVKYYEEEDILGIDNKTRNNFIKPKIISFFEDFNPNSAYKLLAEIPFSLVINTAPDKFLVKAMEDKGLKPSYSYYHKGKPLEEYEHSFKLVEESDDEITTHIFNIFGDYNYHNSMVLTFRDLYEYLYSIMHSYPLDEELKLKIRDANAVLFFGCSFDKWYFQLFFQLFLQIMEVDEEDVLNSHKIDHPTTKNFIMNEFQLDFFDDDAAGAIQTLHEAAQSGKITREKDVSFEGPPPKVYISYKWGGDSEKVANELKDKLNEKNILVKIDKEELQYKGEIEEFENIIGDAESVLLVLSHAYMESIHCMYELSQIYRKGNFKERIFPIVLKDADLFSADELAPYKEFWLKKKKETALKMAEDDAMVDTYMKALTKYSQILKDFDEITGVIQNLNLGYVDEHRDTNFEVIGKEIIKLHRKLLRQAE